MNMHRIVADSLQGKDYSECLNVDGRVKFKYISDKQDEKEWTAGKKVAKSCEMVMPLNRAEFV